MTAGVCSRPQESDTPTAEEAYALCHPRLAALDQQVGQSPDQGVDAVGRALAAVDVAREDAHLVLQGGVAADVVHAALFIEGGRRLGALVLAPRAWTILTGRLGSTCRSMSRTISPPWLVSATTSSAWWRWKASTTVRAQSLGAW